MKRRLSIAVGWLLAVTTTASAQWLNYRDPKIPHTPDGRPNLSAPPPRLADKRVDFSGVWLPDPKATRGGFPEGQTLGEGPVIRLQTEDRSPFPLLPAAEAEYKARLSRGDQNPSSRCMPHTIVDAYLVPSPTKIVHTTGLTILLQEEYQHFRQIFTDGRPFPADMQPALYGYSVAVGRRRVRHRNRRLQQPGPVRPDAAHTQRAAAHDWFGFGGRTSGHSMCR